MPTSKTGYEIRFEDFLGLLDPQQYGTEFIEDVEFWFKCTLQPKEAGSPEFLSATGELLSARAVHEMIQSDKEKQYFLYQSAMSRWR